MSVLNVLITIFFLGNGLKRITITIYHIGNYEYDLGINGIHPEIVLNGLANSYYCSKESLI